MWRLQRPRVTLFHLDKYTCATHHFFPWDSDSLEQSSFRDKFGLQGDQIAEYLRYFTQHDTAIRSTHPKCTYAALAQSLFVLILVSLVTFFTCTRDLDRLSWINVISKVECAKMFRVRFLRSPVWFLFLYKTTLFVMILCRKSRQ